jgi:hypothetical protein
MENLPLNPNLNPNLSSSLIPTPETSISLSLTDSDRALASALKLISEIDKRLTNVERDKVIETLQLPKELIDASGIIPQPKYLKRGRGSRPLLASEIEEAYKQCNNCASEAARWLGVKYETLQRHARRLGIWKTNPWKRGDRKRYWAPDKGKYPLNQILDGKFPEYPIYRLKDLLIRSGTKSAKCEMCEFDEKRITDHKMPLILNFEDGNHKNHKLENIKLYCYNCTFLYGKGYIRRGKVEFHFLDPDRLQDARLKVDARF